MGRDSDPMPQDLLQRESTRARPHQTKIIVPVGLLCESEPVLLNPLPGADTRRLGRALREASTAFTNLRSVYPDARLVSYLTATHNIALGLCNLLRPGDIERLVLTPVYWRMVAGPGLPPGPIAEIIDREILNRVADLDSSIAWLESKERNWQQARFVVADTSFYLHAAKLEVVDFRPILKIREEPIHLFVPVVVLDELDRLKDSGKQSSRWRSAYTLAVLERVIRDPSLPGQLQGEDYSGLLEGHIPRGKVLVEVVLDPPGHQRLPLADDELIDRAAVLQALLGERVTFVTFDTGQAMRARAANLLVERLEHPAESEPEPSTA